MAHNICMIYTCTLCYETVNHFTISLSSALFHDRFTALCQAFLWSSFTSLDSSYELSGQQFYHGIRFIKIYSLSTILSFAPAVVDIMV